MHLCGELVLVKVECDAAHRQEIIAISDVFHAKIVDVSPESVIIELTGVQNKLNAFTLSYLMVLKLQNSQEQVLPDLQEALQI